MSHEQIIPIETAFAPAARLDLEAVRAQRATFLADPLGLAVLEAMSVPAAVLNSQRQVVLGNHAFLDLLGLADFSAILALRPGEAMGCIRADRGPGGCGTSEHCAACGAVGAILGSLSTRRSVERECRVCTRDGTDGGALDLLAKATLVAVGGEDFVILVLQDISSEKRRGVLERVFFHDVLNSCGGIRGLAEMLVEDDLDPETERGIRRDLHTLSGTVIDEITAHRQMLAAERGELQVRLTEVPARDVLEDLVALYRYHPVADRRELRIGSCSQGPLCTDVGLLRRVLGNLVKNALEATAPGGHVTVSAEHVGSDVRFSVHNPGTIPGHVKLQIFQRSFSTKRGEGRGVGTYSVKMFGERHLGGQVAFTSDEPAGTCFTVTLPAAGPPQALAA
jgi:hypothetical protein